MNWNGLGLKKTDLAVSGYRRQMAVVKKVRRWACDIRYDGGDMDEDMLWGLDNIEQTVSDYKTSVEEFQETLINEIEEYLIRLIKENGLYSVPVAWQIFEHDAVRISPTLYYRKGLRKNNEGNFDFAQVGVNRRNLRSFKFEYDDGEEEYASDFSVLAVDLPTAKFILRMGLAESVNLKLDMRKLKCTNR